MCICFVNVKKEKKRSKMTGQNIAVEKLHALINAKGDIYWEEEMLEDMCGHTINSNTSVSASYLRLAGRVGGGFCFI